MHAPRGWGKKAGVVLVCALAPLVGADPGQMDLDRDIDLQDYALFHDCLMGPADPALQIACRGARFDADLDVDLADTAGFLIAFTGPCEGLRSNDHCRCPVTIADGTFSYNNVGADTDGPSEPILCDFFGQTQIRSDLWYCYTASCTGTALVTLCGSSYDTKLAVYSGCRCPIAPPLACSDDDCGYNVGSVQSRVVVSVEQGEEYLIRVGGFLNEQGDGLLTVACNFVPCESATNDCFVVSPTPGCADSECCAETCELDQFCCDVEWDEACAGEAQGICTGSFCSMRSPGRFMQRAARDSRLRGRGLLQRRLSRRSLLLPGGMGRDVRERGGVSVLPDVRADRGQLPDPACLPRLQRRGLLPRGMRTGPVLL